MQIFYLRIKNYCLEVFNTVYEVVFVFIFHEFCIYLLKSEWRTNLLIFYKN